MFINFAHRGASEYAPENTLSAFCLGLEMGANGIETDVRPTKDGVAVLFHDDTLKRITGEEKPIDELTYEELYKRDLGSYKSKKYAGEKIVLFEDFLKYFSKKNAVLAIEIKGAGVEKDVLEGVYKYGAEKSCVITSFMMDSLKLIRSLDGDIPLGFLARKFDEELMDELLALSIGEICPNAADVTGDLVKIAHEKGLNVRAWGVKTEEQMKNCVDAGVNGMTVNFPDKLAAYLAEVK